MTTCFNQRVFVFEFRLTVRMTFLISLFVSAILIQTAESTCALSNSTASQSSGSDNFHISETDPPGTFVLSGTKDANETVTKFDLRSGLPAALGNALQSSFKLSQAPTSFNITTTKVIDLEAFWKTYGRDMSKIVVHIECTNVSLSPVIAVNPVDEFDPTFNASKYTKSIPENTTVGSTVFTLADYVHDEDIPVSTGDLVYSIQENTGTSYFTCDPNTGELKLARVLDYDRVGAVTNFNIVLKVSEFSGQHRKGFASLHITVTNVEDVPPYFIYPKCPSPCMAPLYDALTSINSKGHLSLNPALQSGDDEGFNTPRVYAITQGNDRGMFQIDRTTGQVSQTITVAAAKATEPEFRIIVEVRKNGTDLSAIAVLVIRVKERLGNATTFCSKSTLSAPVQAGPDLLVPMLILGVIAAVALGGFVFMFAMYRRKQPDSHVRPIQVKPGVQNGGLQAQGLRLEYNNKAFTNALPVFNKTQPLSTLK